jgi:hypothetical protein
MPCDCLPDRGVESPPRVATTGVAAPATATATGVASTRVADLLGLGLHMNGLNSARIYSPGTFLAGGEAVGEPLQFFTFTRVRNRGRCEGN